MCNEQRYTESGALIAPTRCREFVALEEDRDGWREMHDRVLLRCRKLKEENARLREALKFYANKYNYTHCYIPGGDNIINVDGGEMAGNALKEVG